MEGPFTKVADRGSLGAVEGRAADGSKALELMEALLCARRGLG